jgi:hypothetical protein
MHDYYPIHIVHSHICFAVSIFSTWIDKKRKMSEHKRACKKNHTSYRSDQIHIALRMEGTRKEATANSRVRLMWLGSMRSVLGCFGMRMLQCTALSLKFLATG